MAHIEYHYLDFSRDGVFEEYLEDMQLRLGTFFDVGVNQCGVPGSRLASVFVQSGLARSFEACVPRYVSGFSGVELLAEAFSVCGVEREVPNESRWPVSPEYWLGYMLPCFQVSTGCSYEHLFHAVSYDELWLLHFRFEERSEDEFVEAVLDLIREKGLPTRLQTRRVVAGLTQQQLAERAGVSLRSIQLYEQRQKDINRAAADTVRRLSMVLTCTMEDLLELAV